MAVHSLGSTLSPSFSNPQMLLLITDEQYYFALILYQAENTSYPLN